MIRRAIAWLKKHWKLATGLAFSLAVIGIVVFVVGVTVWEYTNSTQFCGTTCHTMPPEFAAYERSPHARVACVDCHLGEESTLQSIPRKAKEIRHVYYALTQDYEVPIFIKSLRPARDTCEECHSPEKSANDSFVKRARYLSDQDNTPRYTYLNLKTGGGAKREGLGKGIHWHIVNEVDYLANDPLKQDIPYIKVVNDDGTVTEYYDLESNITPEQVAARSEELRRMDCIDCHNRVSHLFSSPDEAIDDAMSRRLIDDTLPFIKTMGVQAISGHTGSREEALASIARIEDWYKENYPDVYAQKQASVKQAVTELQNVFDAMYFPDMGVGYSVHPNNIGHKDFPGCFRCHDGKHTSAQGETIRLECNICHSIPREGGPGLATPTIALEPSNEPESHKDSNWLARHRNEFDESCSGCHNTANAGGSDNSSFCSNGACHGVKWKYAGLDAPGLRAILPEAPQQEVAPAPDSPEGGVVPYIPHPLSEDRIGQCRNCHGPDGLKPYPEWHKDFPLEACTDCHKLAPFLQTSAAAPAP